MKRFIDILFDIVLATALKIIGMVLVLAILIQIFSRITMMHPFSWTEELSRFSFLWFCFLGSAYTLRMKLHLGIDYFYRKFSVKYKVYVDFFIQSTVIFFGYLLVHYGIVMISLTTFQKSPILRLPMASMYAVLPVTGFFFIIFSLYQVLLLIRNYDEEKHSC